MEASFNEFAKIVTKHALDDPQKLKELKKRFKVLEHANSKAGAAALGYLIAKAENEEKDSDAYDQSLEIIRTHRDNEWICVDNIFTAIYHWLDSEFKDNNETREALKEAFEPFIILD